MYNLNIALYCALVKSVSNREKKMKKILSKPLIIAITLLIALFLSVAITGISPNQSNSVVSASAETTGKTFTDNENYIMAKKINEMPQTYEAVIKLNASQSEESVIVGNYREDWAWCDEGMKIRVNKDGKPALFLDNGNTAYNAEFNISVATGKWLHLAITFNSTTGVAECFVDGVSKGTSNVLAGVSINGSVLSEREFMVGGDYGRYNKRYFKGQIASLAIFSDVRTASEISNDKANGVSATASDLLALYDLNTLNKEKVVDASGNGYDISEKMYLQNNMFTGVNEYSRVTDFAYSFAVVGDTQRMSELYADGLNDMYKWIVNNKNTEKIEYVFGMGDITEQSKVTEWNRAKTSISRLERASMPYSLVRGNHDMKNDYSGDTERQGMNSVFATNAYYVNQFDGFMEEGDVTNSYRAFTVQGTKYLLLTLDYGASDAMLAWAGKVVDNYPDHKVIITTHAYEYYAANKLGTDPGKGSIPGTDNDYDYKKNPTNTAFRDYNNGKQIWDEFAKKHGNIFLILSGHIDSDYVVYHQETGIHGNLVTSILINPQQADTITAGGIGMVTLLKFSADGTKIFVENYSATKGAYYKTLNQFAITVPTGEYRDHAVSSYTVYSGATCTKNKVERGVCTVCGVTHEKEVLGTARGHLLNGVTVNNNDATCIKNGTKSGICGICGEMGTVEIPSSALGHDFSEHTCIDSKCSRCTAVRIKTTNHIWDEGVVVKEPTTTGVGLKKYTCACGETLTEKIDKLTAPQEPTTPSEPTEPTTPAPDNSSSDEGKGCGTIVPFGSGNGGIGGMGAVIITLALIALIMKVGKKKAINK